MKHIAYKSTAVCILGMHRSGTSSITRAINLLGVYLGEDAKVKGRGADNREGFWEHSEICALQERLLARLNQTWDAAAPLPDQWHRSEAVRPFRDELRRLVVTNFANHSLWAWKDPRTCLLLPVWRDVLEELETKLLCVFVVRNPINVTNSLITRDPIPFSKALGVWFNYCIAALKDTAGLPTAFLNYDRFLASWEPELRRCTAVLGLNWPADEQRLREAMNSFIRPNLCHNQSALTHLQSLPNPVQELCQILVEASSRTTAHDDRFNETVNRLSRDFHAYASFFQSGLDEPALRWPYLKRTWQRWQRSFRKRFPNATDKIAQYGE
ncbi:MAG: hypothetical protein ABSD57_00245 [Verrucomicrobiota bacterium]